jgi:hypothetical protein
MPHFTIAERFFAVALLPLAAMLAVQYLIAALVPFVSVGNAGFIKLAIWLAVTGLAGGNLQLAHNLSENRFPSPINSGTGSFGIVRYPPVTLMWRDNAGRWWRRSITKSWPLGLRVIASSIAA